MKHLWRVLSVAIFLFGAVTLLEAHRGSRSGQALIDVTDTELAQSFVVNYVDLRVSPSGTITKTGSTTRYVKADGEWRVELRRNNGQTVSPEASKVYSGTPDGVFEKKTLEGRRFVSPSLDHSILQLYRSHNYLSNHPEFVRTEEVAGLKVYVLRVEIKDASSPEQWQERSYSPKTGLTILRSVQHMRDGSEIRREAVSVEFKDVAEDLNHDLRNLPIIPAEKKLN